MSDSYYNRAPSKDRSTYRVTVICSATSRISAAATTGSEDKVPLYIFFSEEERGEDSRVVDGGVSKEKPKQ